MHDYDHVTRWRIFKTMTLAEISNGDDTIMVKRIEKHPGKLVLRSDNKDYEPVYLSPNEMDSFRIVGKVVWISRDVS